MGNSTKKVIHKEKIESFKMIFQLVPAFVFQLVVSTWRVHYVSSFSSHVSLSRNLVTRAPSDGSPVSRRGRNVWMKDYPKPNVENTENYRIANALSSSFKTTLKSQAKSKKKVAIIGGGLSGLACAKYLVDAGHEPFVYEAR